MNIRQLFYKPFVPHNQNNLVHCITTFSFGLKLTNFLARKLTKFESTKFDNRYRLLQTRSYKLFSTYLEKCYLIPGTVA